ncbi:hypothetical protein [Natronohydrobacter thiooxidans]|uniref:hypothetical protein n=1 Tax=Natronohydrobacter thiooxidans TaxID=87172 RepID=UPI0008FF0FA2|nr:hypothetical protein [Natronohydrobacter thiooxidans]
MRVVTALTLAGSMTLLTACDTSAPYSNVIDTTGRGVGFSDYAQYLRAQEELSRIRRSEVAQARGVQAAPQGAPQFGPQAAAQPATIGQEAVAAVRGTPQTAPQPFPVGQQQPASMAQPMAPVQTAALGATPQQNAPAPRAAGVSEQTFTPQPFGTPQQNRLVERDFVPQVHVSESELMQGSSGPNLFVYALSTQHNVGEARYKRSHPLRWRRWESACAQYPSQDLAQEAFLAAGGPANDPNHLDPDGDGFACWWDPAPFRQAARTVRARQ